MNLSQFCTQGILENNGTYIYCVPEWNWWPSTIVGACAKIFLKSFRVTKPCSYKPCNDFVELYNTHTGKHLVGISPIGMDLIFSEYILGQYLTLISDVISWFEEEHKIMSDKGFVKQFMSQK